MGSLGRGSLVRNLGKHPQATTNNPDPSPPIPFLNPQATTGNQFTLTRQPQATS